MVDPTTTNRSLFIPLRGADPGTWDIPVNANSALLDTITGGVASISTSGGFTVLNAAQLACGTISVSGALSSAAFIQFPAVQGWWTIENLTTNNTAFSVRVICGSLVTAIGIPPGELVDIQININVPKYRNLGRVGGYLDIGSTTVPLWISSSTVPPYLVCDGSVFSAVTYPALADILGSLALPDFRGRAAYYLNQGSGVLTAGGAGIDGNTLKAQGGQNGFTLAATDIPTLTSINPSQGINVVSNATVPRNYSSNTVGTPGTGTPVSFPTGNDINLLSSSGSNSISVTYSNSTPTAIANAAPGTVSGLRLIRAG